VKVLKKKCQFIKKSDYYFAETDAKVERRHYFLEIDEHANLIASSNSRRRNWYLELSTW